MSFTKFSLSALLGLLSLILVSCWNSQHETPVYIEDKFAHTEASVEQQEEFFEVMDTLGGFGASWTDPNLPQKWIYNGVTCLLNTEPPESGGWGFFLETYASCPYTLQISVKFGYNIFQGRVTTVLKSVFKSPEDPEFLSFDLSGQGSFRFETSAGGTRVIGNYDLAGDVHFLGQVYRMDFLNEVNVVESGGESVHGQTYSVLALDSGHWVLGVRSLADLDGDRKTELHQLNNRRVDVEFAESVFSSLSIFGPKHFSLIGRNYVKSARTSSN